MQADENIEPQNTEAEDKSEEVKPQPQPAPRVKKDLPKKKWRKQGLRKSTRMRKK